MTAFFSTNIGTRLQEIRKIENVFIYEQKLITVTSPGGVPMIQFSLQTNLNIYNFTMNALMKPTFVKTIF